LGVAVWKTDWEEAAREAVANAAITSGEEDITDDRTGIELEDTVGDDRLE